MSDEERPRGMVETFEQIAVGVWTWYWGSSDEVAMDPHVEEEEAPYIPEPLAPPNPNLHYYAPAKLRGNIRPQRQDDETSSSQG